MRSTLSAAQRRDLTTLVAAHPVLADVGRRFAEAGEELALVGGPVRDALLGRARPNDLDLTTSARPERTLEIVSGWADATWEIGIAYGTIGLRKGDDHLEITTYRSDVYAASSRKPAVAFGDSLVGDLRRRDFTVNAMAVQLPGLDFVDPTEGLDDLADQVITTHGAPEDSFSDDPLRMLRAARFAAQLGFEVDPATISAIRSMTGRLAIISVERVRDEMIKLLVVPEPRRGLSLLVDTGLAELVLPELPRLQLEIDEHHHHKDVYEHTLTVLEQVIALEQADRSESQAEPEPDFVLRFAALMHDVGKPKTRRHEPDGGVSFHHHEVIGAKLTRARMKTLRFPKDVTDAVCLLVELHLRFHGYADAEWSDAAVRRYVRDAGDQLDRLHKLTRADCTTRNTRKADRLRRAYDDLELRIAALREQEELGAMRPDLDGNAIIELLGVGPGPVVGQAYRYLLELRVEHGPLGPERAREALLAWWSEQPGPGPRAAGSGRR